MTIVSNNMPFKIYEAKNAATTEAYVYLGKTSIASVNGATTNYFAAQNENCYTTFLFASLIAGKNIRIDPATEKDPFIYLDSRFYDFRPCGATSSDPFTWPKNSILSSVEHNGGDITVYLKNITTDGTINVQSEDCKIKLSVNKYRAANICDTNGVLRKTEGVPGASDVVFYFKSIVAGNCITVNDTGDSLVIGFDRDNCDPCNALPSLEPTNPPACSTWVPPSATLFSTVTSTTPAISSFSFL